MRCSAHQRTKLSPSNHNLLENGGAASLDGAAGHYQWGGNVPFYYQVYEDDNYLYETVSLGGPRPGYWNYYIPVGSRSCAGYAAMDRTNTKLMSVVNSTAQFRGGILESEIPFAQNSRLPEFEMLAKHYAEGCGAVWYNQYKAVALEQQAGEGDVPGAVRGVYATNPDGDMVKFEAAKAVALCAGDYG